MKAKKVKELLNITQQTLNNWIKSNKIKYTKINSHHIEYDDDFVYSLLGNNKENKLNIIYSI
jgi:predicted site-specific integrase-resolvase